MKKVLLPLDLCEDSPLVAAFASGLGSVGVTEVLAVHVLGATGAEGPVLDKREADALARLEEMAGPIRQAGIEVEAMVVEGDPLEELSRICDESGADAVVCGCHGKSAVDSFLLGSVSERLMGRLDCPMLMVRFDLLKNDEAPKSLAARFPLKLLLATDFSDASGRAFDFALRFGRKVGTLFILNVVPGGLSGDEEAGAVDAADAKLRDMLVTAKEAGVSASGLLVEGDPWRQILAEMDSRRMSGVIVGTRGLNPLEEALVGSVSKTLLRQSSVPVLAVP